MAGWGEKLNKMTQTAISKSKEMAEVTKLNMEINSFNQNIKEIYNKVGEYVLTNGLLADDTAVAEFAEQVAAIKANIAANQEKLLEVKNIYVCPGCGAEVPRTSKFCDKCGKEMPKVTEAEAEAAPAPTVCKSCGTQLEAGALFCGNCGTKQE